MEQSPEVINFKGYRYRVVTIDLTNGLNDYQLPIAGAKIISIDGSQTLQVKLNSNTNDKIPLKPNGVIDDDFFNIYITTSPHASTITLYIASNTRQSVGTMEVTVDNVDTIINPISVVNATTPIIYNEIIAVASTEQSKQLPANTKKLTFKARNGIIKVCFTQNESGTKFIKLLDGMSWNEDNIKLANVTAYFQSDTAGCVLEIIAFT